ncbi:MAG: MFS transporter [Planctomycetota bacterium]|jgi:MFS family permease|nr:MFS transporter [Planctomycetota bacterium]
MLPNKRRFRLMLYFVPALLDCITGIFTFIGPVRAAILGYDPLVAGSMVTARSLACCLFGLLASRFLSGKNAARLMFFSNVMLIGVCLLGLAAVNLAMLYLILALVGVFQVIFFASFQLFMKMVDEDDATPLSRVVGSYTLAWCLGMSFGPFLTGLLLQIGKIGGGESPGWKYAYLAATLLALVLLILLGRVVKGGREILARRVNAPDPASPGAEGGRPNLAWLGWSMAFFSLIASGMVRGVFPSEATRAGMPEWRSGSVMMALSLATGVFAYVLSRRERWMYSGVCLLRLGLLGSAGLLFFLFPLLAGWELLDHAWQFYLAALLFGSYTGSAYLYSGFHALAYPDEAGRNIALNESCIAGGVILGPLLGGILAKYYGFYPPFALAALLVSLLGLFQWRAHGRYPALPAPARRQSGRIPAAGNFLK